VYICSMEIEQKHCNFCNTTKPLDEFGKDSHQSDGLTCRCTLCRREQQKEWRAKNPEKVKALNERKKGKRDIYYQDPERKLKYRKAYIEKQFNIEYSLYEQLQESQNNLCAICGFGQRDEHLAYLCVDHDHETGKVRELLCGPCNRALGHFLDDISVVNNALQYLLKHKQTANDIS
jgi:hypothetical protein